MRISEGENLKIDPPRRLVQTFRALWGDDVKQEGTSRVTWEIEPVGDSCRLTVIHDQMRESANDQLYGGNHERHAIDFIEAVRARRDPICTIEMGRDAAVFAHLGNIALRTGSRVVWDSEARRFVGNVEADALLRPEYREPWDFPG